MNALVFELRKKVWCMILVDLLKCCKMTTQSEHLVVKIGTDDTSENGPFNDHKSGSEYSSMASQSGVGGVLSLRRCSRPGMVIGTICRPLRSARSGPHATWGAR